MKRFYFLVMFALLAIVVSCSTAIENEESVDITKSELSIGLPVEVSRTTMDSEGKASWAVGDTFALWAEDETGAFALDGAKFNMMYYWHSFQSAVFTSSAKPIAEGAYTYYAVSPMPQSISNRKATYTIPAEQRGDSFNGAYDIMVAAPLEADAVESGKVNTLNLDFHHKMHILKMSIPSDKNTLLHPVSRLVFTFPTSVTGEIQVDPVNPSNSVEVTAGSNQLTVNIPNGYKDGDNLLSMIIPGNISGDVSYYAESVVGQLTSLRTFTMTKDCLEGHITPLSITIPEPIPPTILRFSIGKNYLGENVQKITIYDNNGSTVATFNANSNNVYDLTEYVLFEEGVFKNYGGLTFSVQFESEHAIMKKQFSLPANIVGHQVNTISPVDVPYLFAEDFSSIHTSFEKDDERVSNLMSADGMLLNEYMSVSGWNGAHIKGVAGQSVRVNVRHQSTFGVTRSNGRLDTPALKNLKAGANAKLKVEFDMGGYVNSGYGSNNDVFCIAGIHSNSESSVLNGVVNTKAFGNVGNDTDRVSGQFSSVCWNKTIPSNYSNDSFASTFPTYSFTASGCSSTTRICWIPCCSQTTVVTANNAHYYLYIDNIRISIAQ
uniref:fimbrillin family protein n=1 Tax=Alistipes sp. TaxID=1872444 RepID=UPI0040567B3C